MAQSGSWPQHTAFSLPAQPKAEMQVTQAKTDWTGTRKDFISEVGQERLGQIKITTTESHNYEFQLGEGQRII